MTTAMPSERLSLVSGAGRTESLVRQAFDLATDGIDLLDVTGPLAKIVLANSSLAVALGATPAALARSPLQTWLDASSAAEAQRAISQATPGASGQRPEICLVCADGTHWWAQALFRHLANGDAPLVLAWFSDITARKAIESAAATLPVAMVGLDRDLRIAWVNPGAADFIRHPSQQLLGVPWFGALPELAPRCGRFSDAQAKSRA